MKAYEVEHSFVFAFKWDGEKPLETIPAGTMCYRKCRYRRIPCWYKPWTWIPRWKKMMTRTVGVTLSNTTKDKLRMNERLGTFQDYADKVVQDSRERCETCRFFHRTFPQCRRHAPPETVDEQHRMWPRVDYDDWCGDWEKSPDSI